MYIKVEPSGCCERKGMVQIRLCMYLDPTDYGYERHYVNVIDTNSAAYLKGYKGEVDAMGRPIDQADYDSWFNSLPKVWQNNPFHNHFVYVEPDITDIEIMQIGEAFLAKSYVRWGNNEKLDLKNPPISFPSIVDNTRKKAVETKVKHLEDTVLEKKV